MHLFPGFPPCVWAAQGPARDKAVWEDSDSDGDGPWLKDITAVGAQVAPSSMPSQTTPNGLQPAQRPAPPGAPDVPLVGRMASTDVHCCWLGAGIPPVYPICILDGLVSVSSLGSPPPPGGGGTLPGRF
jgi:hypothetical protein